MTKTSFAILSLTALVIFAAAPMNIDAQESPAGEEALATYQAKADSCLAENDFDGAIGWLRAAYKEAAVEEKKAQILWEIANIYAIYKSDYINAARTYKRFVSEFPDNPLVDQAYLKLGKAFIVLKDPKRATKYLEKVDVGSQYFSQSQNLLAWLRKNWKQEVFFNARRIMIGISILEFAFIIAWILLSKEAELHILVRKPRFWAIFIVLLIFLAGKLYFNFMLYNLLQGLSP
ncbi:hypothetical protein DRQ05_04565 [bacterium]|nr:MAG: hypothetical protein DRQ05_04565 [bacterium]